MSWIYGLLYGFWWWRLLLHVFLPSIGVSEANQLLVYLAQNMEISACVCFLKRPRYSIYKNSVLGFLVNQVTYGPAWHSLGHSQAFLSPQWEGAIEILHRNILNQIHTATVIWPVICRSVMQNATAVQASISWGDQCSSSSVIAFASGN